MSTWLLIAVTLVLLWIVVVDVQLVRQNRKLKREGWDGMKLIEQLRKDAVMHRDYERLAHAKVTKTEEKFEGLKGEIDLLIACLKNTIRGRDAERIRVEELRAHVDSLKEALSSTFRWVADRSRFDLAGRSVGFEWRGEEEPVKVTLDDKKIGDLSYDGSVVFCSIIDNAIKAGLSAKVEDTCSAGSKRTRRTRKSARKSGGSKKG